MPEALGQDGTRQAHVTGQPGNCPSPRRVGMEQSKSLSDFRIASTSQPTRLPRGQRHNITPKRLNEQRFGKAGEDRFSSGGQGASFRHREPDCILKPLPGTLLTHIHFEYTRKSCEQDAAQLRVAGQLSANKFRDFAASSDASNPKTLLQDAMEFTSEVHGIRSGVTGDYVSIAVREHNDVAGG